MRAIALLGAPQDLWPANIKQELVAGKENGDLLIGVDRGSLLLKELGFTADVAVGDFDSLQKAELNKIEQSVNDIRYSVPEKDLTDAELLLQIAFEDYHVSFLTLFGATGGRLDHFLSNLLMMLKPEFNRYAEKIEILDQQNSIKFYNPGTYKIKKLAGYTYLGIASLTAVQNLNISGAKYSLSDYSGSIPMSFSSNEFLPESNSFELSFKKGVACVIQSKDIDRFQNI